MPKAVSRFIDMARWIAAVAVMLGHSAFISLPDITTAPHPPCDHVWWFVTLFYRQAVVVFFVLSGFLVGGALLSRARSGEPFLLDYLVDRVGRIHLVFLPALFLGYCLDLTGQSLFSAGGRYAHPAFAGAYAPERLLGALVMLQSLWSGQVGTNGPLWSLACEFWYYVASALLILPLARAYGARARAAGCLAGVGLVAFLGLPESYFLFGYGVWALGALARHAPRPLVASKWAALAIFVATASVIRLTIRGPLLAAHPSLSLAADAATAATFANVLLSLRFVADEGFSFCRLSFHRALADFSYSLYATHGPLVVFLLAAVGAGLGEGWLDARPTPLHWAVQFSVLATLVGAAYAFSRVTEARTPQARDALRRAARALAARMEAMGCGRNGALGEKSPLRADAAGDRRRDYAEARMPPRETVL